VACHLVAERVIRTVADALVTALLAPACAVCNAVLDHPTHGCICSNCWRSIRPITPPICDRCGDPLAQQNHSPIPDPQSFCARCSATESAIVRARAVGEYEGTLREIIHALKYSGRHSLARPLAGQMRRRGHELLEKADCVVPVPLHWRREYKRGFNQARAIANHLGLTVVDALIRRRSTRAQVELAADRRRANVAGAFRLRRRCFQRTNVAGLRIVLVDDVSTTGATLEACARVLKEGGASEVYALTGARVITRRRPSHIRSPPSSWSLVLSP
jgi:ComF family protein